MVRSGSTTERTTGSANGANSRSLSVMARLVSRPRATSRINLLRRLRSSSIWTRCRFQAMHRFPGVGLISGITQAPKNCSIHTGLMEVSGLLLRTTPALSSVTFPLVSIPLRSRRVTLTLMKIRPSRPHTSGFCLPFGNRDGL